MNAYQQKSLAMYKEYSSQGQSQSLGVYHGYANAFLHHQDVSMPMFCLWLVSMHPVIILINCIAIFPFVAKASQ